MRLATSRSKHKFDKPIAAAGINMWPGVSRCSHQAPCGLVYQRGLFFGQKRRTVKYITPIASTGNYQWVIVIDANIKYRLKRPKIEPMWRRLAKNETATQSRFPADWQDMRSWPSFNSLKSEDLGLPRMLQKHYLKYKDEISKHCTPRWNERIVLAICGYIASQTTQLRECVRV
jgi:hypothetical protein